MTCRVDRPTFRLLDPIGGWEETEARDLAFSRRGVTLADSRPGVASVTAGEVARLILPRHLAHDGCGRWYLVHDERLLTLGPCDTAFGPLGGPVGAGPVGAVAAAGPALAVLDGAGGRLILLDDGGHRAVARFPLPWAAGQASAVALTGPPGRPPETLLVAGPGPEPATGLVVAFDVTGRELQRWLIRSGAAIVALGSVPLDADADADADCGCGEAGAERHLVAATAPDGTWREIWLLEDGPGPGRTVEAPVPVCRLGLLEGDGSLCAVVTEAGFRLGPPPGTRCFDRSGSPIDPDLVGPALAGPPRRRSGWFVTAALDGGHDGARWHRVRLEAEVPDSTTVGIDVCAVADPDQVPGPDDWEPIGPLDGLIRLQPPGRLFRVRVRLAGDGVATPAVSRIRLDIDPRSTAAALPSIYLDDPPAAEFTERFVALFDAVIGDVDAAIAASSVLYDPDNLRDELLGVLLAALGLPDDPAWDATQRRNLLHRAGPLLSGRGTPAGLIDVVRTVHGVTVDIDERGADRPWGVIGRTRLGTARLPARSRAAARIGVSALGGARIDSFSRGGDGTFSSGAYRVTVRVPYDRRWTDQRRRHALESLIRSWAPAELAVTVQFSAGRFQLGGPLRLGIDTSLRGLPAGVIGGSGGRAVRLGRSSVVAGRKRHIGQPTVVGVRSNLGLNTTVG